METPNGRVSAWLIGLLCIGCSDAAQQPDPVPVVVEETEVWSGTSVTVVSGGFAHDDPVVLLDGDTLAFVRVNDSTLDVGLPDLPGTRRLHVISPFVLATDVPIHLNGFVSTDAGPMFMGRAVRGASPTELYGSGPFGLRRWNVSTGGTVDYPDSMHIPTCSRGVGQGPAPVELVLHSGSCPAPWRRWRVEPTIEWLGTVPANSDRFVDMLAPGRYVAPGSHYFVFWTCDTACTFQLIRGESGFDVVHSPAGDRAVLLSYVDSGGAPVIDVSAGKIGYVVPAFGAPMAAAFSEAGDTLFLGGYDEPAPTATLLAAVRASDGLVYRLDTLPHSVCGIALDPVRPWLYVAGGLYDPVGRWPVLSVLNRTTFEPIATLRAPDSLYSFNPCAVLPSPLERRVFVVDLADVEFTTFARPPVVRFETPPLP